jgi:Tol biopolymer transport system component
MQVCISSSGTIAYPKNISMPRSLVWVDFEGKEENLNTPPDLYASLKVSHDGTRVALGISDSTGNHEIGIWNIARRGMIRLPNKGTINYMPNWAPDSQSIVFGLMRGSKESIGCLLTALELSNPSIQKRGDRSYRVLHQGMGILYYVRYSKLA